MDRNIASTILKQMGGAGRLNAMVGANNFLTIDQGVQFSFKGSKKANKVIIKLTEMDLYNIEFYKINMRNIDKSMIPVNTIEGAYEDMLKPIFEETTGLYLSF